MSAVEFSAVGFLIIGLVNFLQLSLVDRVRNLDWFDRLGRYLLGGAFVCFGAGGLAPADPASRHLLGGLALVLGGASVVEVLARKRRERRVQQ